MRRLISGLSYANVMSTLCLFMLLGGGAYAATKLPKGSVGSAQIKRSAVTTSKVKNRSLRAVDFKRGQLPRGPQGPAGARGPAGASAGPAERTFGRIAADGTLDQTRKDGVFLATKRVAPGSGNYCLNVITPTGNDTYTDPRSVTVTPESPDTAVAATLDRSAIPPNCGNVYITITDASDATPKDSAFYVRLD